MRPDSEIELQEYLVLIFSHGRIQEIVLQSKCGELAGNKGKKTGVAIFRLCDISVLVIAHSIAGNS